ncbi:MAG: nuclear transport factor 2 family protein [Rhodospirillaceae bacterium]
MSQRDALLFANDAFYAAFVGNDFDAMDGVWSDRDDITCTHPGWSMIAGRDAVMESWRGILESGETRDIRHLNAEAYVLGDAGYVLCYESLGGGYLAATNVFVKDGSIWRMVHHQAGPSSARRLDAPVPPAPRVQ